MKQETITLTFHFHDDLPMLLRGKRKGSTTVTIGLDRRASVKDIVESFGLPHTEIGSIVCKGKEIDYRVVVEKNTVFDVHGIPVPWPVTMPTVLRPSPLFLVSFVVDINVGRLAKYLRAAGFDTLYDSSWNDEFIADLMQREKRVLLTRDMRLLMRSQIEFGRYIRETHPMRQLQEVLHLFGLSGHITPFTRCLECNSLLQGVSKEEILHRLEPLTKKYYSSFSRCLHCDKIYWPGSHIEKMQRLFS